MPLLDWFRGRSGSSPETGAPSDSEAERMEARRHEQEPAGGVAQEPETTTGASDEGAGSPPPSGA